MKKHGSNGINALLGTFEKVARATAGRHDIQVIPSQGCSTDGRRIFFPTNADHFKEATKNTLAGWLDHEVGHIVEEDAHRLAGRTTPLDVMARAVSSKERLMFNVFEDIRMETKKAQELVGVADNLRAAALHSVRLVGERVNAPGFDNFWYAVGCAIVEKARGGTAAWLPAKYQPYIDAIGAEISESVNLDATRWAEDAWALAQRVLAKVADVAQAAKQEQGEEGQGEEGQGEEGQGEEGQGEDSGQGEEGQGEEGQGEEGQGEEGQGEEGQGEEGQGEDSGAIEDIGDTTENGTGGKAEGEPGQGKDGTEEAEGEQTRATGEAGERVAVAEAAEKDASLTDLMDETKGELAAEAEAQRVTDQEGGRFAVTAEAAARDCWVTPVSNAHRFERSKNAVAGQIRVMKAKLLNLVRTQAESTTVGDMDEGDLDVDALAGVRTGNRRVFTQLVAGQTLDTAVSILVDQSGSMHGSKADHACMMAIALSETFNQLGVPFEVIGFHNRFGDGWPEGIDPYQTRTTAFEFQVFKGFDEQYRSVRTRLGSIDGYEDNCDHEAVLAAAKRLVVRPERRKILFVLSDGIPACGIVHQSLLAEELKRAVTKVVNAGIEVVGIGALTNSVQQFYNDETGAKSMVVMDIGELAVTVYKAMKDMLLGQRARGRRAS